MYLVRIIIAGFLLAMVACGSAKDYTDSDIKAFKNGFRKDNIIAWNEDTLFNYQVALLDKGRFVYFVKRPDSSQHSTAHYYGGSYYIIGDSISLRFRNDIAPAGFAKYMVDEVSGKYLIQYFTDGTPRVFLRIQQGTAF